MADYRTIYSFCLKHDYYLQNICRAIEISITPEGAALLRQRGLIFKQTKENEWSIIGDFEGAGVEDKSDILTLKMTLVEPQFVYFTIWQDFKPTNAYHLSLPYEKPEEEATNLIKYCEGKQEKNSFCSIDINLSNEMFKKARVGKTETNTLIFRSPKVYWEYLFISRNEKINEKLKIEEHSGKIVFEQMKKIEIEAFTAPILHSITKSPIPMNEHYKLELSLLEILNKDPPKKRVLIKHLPYPPIGRFITEQTNTIRQICYY